MFSEPSIRYWIVKIAGEITKTLLFGVIIVVFFRWYYKTRADRCPNCRSPIPKGRDTCPKCGAERAD